MSRSFASFLRLPFPSSGVTGSAHTGPARQGGFAAPAFALTSLGRMRPPPPPRVFESRIAPVVASQKALKQRTRFPAGKERGSSPLRLSL